MENLIRIDFSELAEDGDAVIYHECLPAIKTETSAFRIIKPPIFVDAPNVFDIVAACATRDPHVLAFQRILKPAGYHLVRVAPDVLSKESVEATAETLKLLEDIGCVLSHNEERAIISIGIPHDGVTASKLVLSAEIESIWECKLTDRQRIVSFLEKNNAIER